MEPLVSICIPAYNAENFISNTIESAIVQRYPNFEIIVSDDLSTDNTVRVVEKFIPYGVRLIRQSRNIGMPGNWNSTIRASRGKYVLKLDADDLIDPMHLEEQICVLEEHPEIVFAHCACRIIDARGRLLGYERSIHGSFIHSGMEEWRRYLYGPRAVNIVTIRRSSYDQVGGYDERYPLSADWAMHRALLQIGSVYYNDHVIASYRSHRVGKEGRYLKRAVSHLLHLEQIEEQWPEEIPNKLEEMKKVRKYWAKHAIMLAVQSEGQERRGILQLVPSYSTDKDILFYANVVGCNGVDFLRWYFEASAKLRFFVKGLIFMAKGH